jgi:glucuronosyltransferase
LTYRKYLCCYLKKQNNRKVFPQDVKKFIDDATDGAIYISMGSNLKSSEMPEDKRQAFLEAISKLKQRVLWKWETDSLQGQPKNVMINKWLPQSDILGNISLYCIILLTTYV